MCCLQIRRDRGVRGILTLLGLSLLCRTNIVVRNLQLVNLRMVSIYLLHIRFNLRTVAIALVVVYSTNNNSRSVVVEAGHRLSVSRSCRVVGLGALVPRRGLWRGKTWTQTEPRLRVGTSILFVLEILNAFAIIKKNLESDKRIG